MMIKKYDNYIKEYFGKPWFHSLLRNATKDELQTLIEYIANELGETYIDKYQKYQKLGSGAFGTAFELKSGKVLKLTTDENEAKIGNYISSRKYLFKHIINYYDVYKIKGENNMWILTMDKIEPISKHLSGDQYDFWNEIVDIYANKNINWFFNYEKEYNLPGNEDIKLYIEQIWGDIQGMLKELKKIKVENPDIHPGNLGMKDGRYVYYDVSGEYYGPEQDIKIMDIDKIINKINTTQSDRPLIKQYPWELRKKLSR